MAFENKTWALSGINVSVAGDYIPPEEGYQYLKITSASYDENNARYKIGFTSLSNNADFSQMYFFSAKDDDSFPPKLTNVKQMGVVASLGKALSGTNIGIPNPESIVGGVVLADVKLETYNDKTRAKIWKYEPVPRDIVESFADIEQFYEPTDEDVSGAEEPSEEASE